MLLEAQRIKFFKPVAVEQLTSKRDFLTEAWTYWNCNLQWYAYWKGVTTWAGDTLGDFYTN